MKIHHTIFIAAAAVVLAAWNLRAEEAQPLAPYQPAENETSTLRIWGDRHMERLTQAWARAYRRAHPEITFEIKLLGNGTAMPALYLGLADLAFFGRDTITTDNDGFAHVLKYKPLRIELGTGSLDLPGHATALALFVHRDNPLERLTLVQVDAIFSTLRKRGAPEQIRTWGQLGVKGEWADHPIHLYADDTESMTGLFFQHAALQDSRMMNWEEFTEFNDVRHGDGTMTDAAEQSMAALKKDRFGLAISNLHYVSAETKPTELAVEDGEPYYAPTRRNLVERNYPLTRTIFACANHRPGRPLDPKVRDFLRFILSAEGQGVLAQDDEYLPLTTKMSQAQLQKL